MRQTPLPDSVFVYAARYARHRNTGAALQVVSEILHSWDNIPKQTQEQLQREAREATTNLEDWRRLIVK